jgi:hypothetical protein
MNTNVSEEHRARMLAHLARRARVTVSIEWISVLEQYPHVEETVLVSRDGNDIGDPVWLGYTDGKRWLDACTGSEFGGRVTHWAELPMSPNPQPVKERA